MGTIETLFEVAGSLLATFDRDGRFVLLNSAWERLLGWSEEELSAALAVDFVHPLDRERTVKALSGERLTSREGVEFENRWRCRDGSYRRLEWRARLVEDTWYAVAHDVTRSRLHNLERARDPLTGLANRAAATEWLKLAIRRLERQPGLIAVLFVDLDGFKLVNDTRGHDFGDRVLCAAATRLLDSVRAMDAVARFGGDEFVILIEYAVTIPDVAEVARRVVQALEPPLEIAGVELKVGASVGVATSASPGASPESLLREADLAMYQSKARGGGCYSLFEAAPRRSAMN